MTSEEFCLNFILVRAGFLLLFPYFPFPGEELQGPLALVRGSIRSRAWWAQPKDAEMPFFPIFPVFPLFLPLSNPLGTKPRSGSVPPSPSPSLEQGWAVHPFTAAVPSLLPGARLPPWLEAVSL